MDHTPRFSKLSPARQALVRICQAVNFGEIQGVLVRDADPVFSPAPVMLVDVKLDADEGPRPERDLTDFELPDEVRRLLCRLNKIQNGMIERIEVRAGVPRRIVFKSSLTEVLR
jgi:hypothetical protein